MRIAVGDLTEVHAVGQGSQETHFCDGTDVCARVRGTEVTYRRRKRVPGLLHARSRTSRKYAVWLSQIEAACVHHAGRSLYKPVAKSTDSG